MRCDICGAEFEPRDSRQKRCSFACRQEANRRRSRRNARENRQQMTAVDVRRHELMEAAADRSERAFSARLAAARKARGLSQPELERAACLGRNCVYKYESGAMSPTIGVVARLSVALGVGPGWLMGERVAGD